MQEYVTEAIVLNQEFNGDLDSRCTIFTKQFGKLTAKIKSVRKITSKLAGHMQIGNRVVVRFVEKGGLQLVDALKDRKLALAPADLYFLHRILPEGEPDLHLWQELNSGTFNWRKALKILGWDPAYAECATTSCPSRAESGSLGEPAAFGLAAQEFFCKLCAFKVKPNEIIYLE